MLCKWRLIRSIAYLFSTRLSISLLTLHSIHNTFRRGLTASLICPIPFHARWNNMVKPQFLAAALKFKSLPESPVDFLQVLHAAGASGPPPLLPSRTSWLKHDSTVVITSRPFLKTAGGIVLGSVAVSADVLPYISVAIKASFLKLGMCNICKNNIAKNVFRFF